jgi:hypothetical protein
MGWIAERFIGTKASKYSSATEEIHNFNVDSLHPEFVIGFVSRNLCRSRTPDYTYECMFWQWAILSGQILAILGRFCPDFELASKIFADLSGSVG